LSALSDQKLTLGDAWLEVFQQVLLRNQFCAAGKLLARAYREEFGEEPPRRQQFVDGAPRQVKSYRRWGCTQGRLDEVDAFYWTVLAPDIVNPGREEQGSFSV